MENNKKTKIDAAIHDTQLRLDMIRRDVMLSMREAKVLEEQIETLEAIKNNDKLI